ncbi:MAG: hypothetical protein WC333_00385 [Dehalococcoidia bacterium]|jgi:hypothetical protein
MKRIIFFRFISLIIFFFATTSMISNGSNNSISSAVDEILLYEDVWGSIYHAEESQCDSTPYSTADGSRINPWKASGHRWIAISQEMIDDEYRAKLVKSTDPRFKGRIKYGDTVWIDSPYKEINGWWVVCDAKNKRYVKSIDFLQTIGDKTLIENYPRWSGKFENIKICRFSSNS